MYGRPKGNPHGIGDSSSGVATRCGVNLSLGRNAEGSEGPAPKAATSLTLKRQ